MAKRRDDCIPSPGSRSYSKNRGHHMFTWICPQCGREVPPAYNECPDCSAKAAAGAPPPADTAGGPVGPAAPPPADTAGSPVSLTAPPQAPRSEEHTSEL